MKFVEQFENNQNREKIEEYLTQIFIWVEQDWRDFVHGGYPPEETKRFLKEKCIAPNEVAEYLFEKSSKEGGAERILAGLETLEELEKFIWAANIDAAVEEQLNRKAMQYGLENLAGLAEKLHMDKEGSFFKDSLKKLQQKNEEDKNRN